MMTLVDKKPLFKRDEFNQQVILPINDEELKSIVSTITNCDTKENQPNIDNKDNRGKQENLEATENKETQDSGELVLNESKTEADETQEEKVENTTHSQKNEIENNELEKETAGPSDFLGMESTENTIISIQGDGKTIHSEETENEDHGLYSDEELNFNASKGFEDETIENTQISIKENELDTSNSEQSNKKTTLSNDNLDDNEKSELDENMKSLEDKPGNTISKISDEMAKSPEKKHENTNSNKNYKRIKSRSTITKIKITQTNSNSCYSPPWTTKEPGVWDCLPITPPYIQCTLKCNTMENGTNTAVPGEKITWTCNENSQQVWNISKIVACKSK